jgi:hypothetical protein
MWFVVIRRTLFGIAVANATLAGYLIVKEGFSMSVAVLPSIALPIMAGCYFAMVYESQCHHHSLIGASDIDRGHTSYEAGGEGHDPLMRPLSDPNQVVWHPVTPLTPGAPSTPARQQHMYSTPARQHPNAAAGQKPNAATLSTIFDRNFYRQPVLIEGDLAPEPCVPRPHFCPIKIKAIGSSSMSVACD